MDIFLRNSTSIKTCSLNIRKKVRKFSNNSVSHGSKVVVDFRWHCCCSLGICVISIFVVFYTEIKMLCRLSDALSLSNELPRERKNKQKTMESIFLIPELATKKSFGNEKNELIFNGNYILHSSISVFFRIY